MITKEKETKYLLRFEEENQGKNIINQGIAEESGIEDFVKFVENKGQKYIDKEAISEDTYAYIKKLETLIMTLSIKLTKDDIQEICNCEDCKKERENKSKFENKFKDFNADKFMDLLMKSIELQEKREKIMKEENSNMDEYMKIAMESFKNIKEIDLMNAELKNKFYSTQK